MSIKPIQKTGTTGEYIIDRDSSDNILKMQGTTVPANGSSGYAKGCVFLKTDATTGAFATYTNKGTTTSCAFSIGGTPGLVTYTETITYDAFTDGGSTSGTLELDTTIPAGAIAVQTLLTDVTGFAGDTSAVITIGDGTDADRYNTGTPNVFADADNVSAGAVSGTAYHSTAKTPTVTVTSATDFSSVSAGAVTITLMYYAV